MYDKKLLEKGNEGNEGNRKISHVSFDALIVHMRCKKCFLEVLSIVVWGGGVTLLF
jgi:hypothetical protein